MQLTKKEKQEMAYLESRMATMFKAKLAESLCDFVRSSLNLLDAVGLETLMEQTVEYLLQGQGAVTSREVMRECDELERKFAPLASVLKARLGTLGEDELSKAQMRLDEAFGTDQT
jgi:hypothetical protein